MQVRVLPGPPSLLSQAFEQVANGIDPSAARKAKRLAQIDATANTFRSVALEWHKKFSKGWTARHASRVLRRLGMHVFPTMGPKAICDVSGGDAQAVLTALNDKNKVDTALRCLQYMMDIEIYAAGRAPPLIGASPFAHIKATDLLNIAQRLIPADKPFIKC